MIENRELTMDDYLAMLRRRAKVILVPVLVAPLLGYLAFVVVNHYFAKYTSQSTILVEAQKVPENMVQPVVSEDLGARMATLQQQVMSQTNLQPVVERVFPGKNSQQVGEIIDNIRLNMTVQQVPTDLLQLGAKKKPGAQGGNSGGFYVSYTAPNAREAQQICAELTSLMMNENLKSVQAAAKGTSDVLSKGIEDAKRNLDDLDSKLAAFKKEHQGQLPGDEDSNLKILMGMNQQLEAQTQALNRDQQDREYTQSILAQQVAAWRSTQSSTNPQTLEKQLSDLQSQLLSLQARYTEDHPDVIKTKADIAEVKKKLAEVNKSIGRRNRDEQREGVGDGAARDSPVAVASSSIGRLDQGSIARSEKAPGRHREAAAQRVPEPRSGGAIQRIDARLQQRVEVVPGPSGQKERSRFDREYDEPGARGADGSACAREPSGVAELPHYLDLPRRWLGCRAGARNRSGDVAGVA